MTTLPPLFKITKTGNTQFCSISYHDAIFSTTWGVVGGKEQVKHTECFATNIGRANYRTPAEQAEMEAHAKHTAKIKTGYVTDLTPGAVENVVLLPQKVKVYQDQLHNIADNVYISDKLNGVNGMFILEDSGKLVLRSRGGDYYPALPHLTEDIISAMRSNDIYVLNVELYIPGKHLQDIQAAVKKPNKLSSQIRAYIFELPEYSGTYEDKVVKLRAIRDNSTTRNVSVIHSALVPKSNIDSYFDNAIRRGCEGIIIRNPTGMYQYNQRSSDVFKYKKAKDAEFKIVGFNVDKDNYPILHCMSDGGMFKVRPKGNAESRINMLDNIDNYIGKYYTVEFETYSKAGKPLKPVGLGLRATDKNGAPIE